MEDHEDGRTKIIRDFHLMENLTLTFGGKQNRPLTSVVAQNKVQDGDGKIHCSGRQRKIAYNMHQVKITISQCARRDLIYNTLYKTIEGLSWGLQGFGRIEGLGGFEGFKNLKTQERWFRMVCLVGGCCGFRNQSMGDQTPGNDTSDFQSWHVSFNGQEMILFRNKIRKKPEKPKEPDDLEGPE